VNVPGSGGRPGTRPGLTRGFGAAVPRSGTRRQARPAGRVGSWRGAAPLPRRAEEHDPHREVVGEVLEAVDLVGGDEEQRARRERLDPVAHPELPPPRRDDVQLVAVVGGLRVVASGRVEAHLEVAVDEDLGRVPACWERQGPGRGQATGTAGSYPSSAPTSGHWTSFPHISRGIW
jgi:hypothetical protein